MRRIILILLTVSIAFSACQRDRNLEGKDIDGPEENSVEISIANRSSASTRGETQIPEENIVNELDLLVFKGDEFQYWRSAYKYSEKFRATLTIDTGLDVYFFANCRDIITGIYDLEDESKNLKVGISWAEMMTRLKDESVDRLCVDETTVDKLYLPMWGRLLDQEVKDIPVNKWDPVELLRSVASVDISVDNAVSNFLLQKAYLYFVPNMGYLATPGTNLKLNADDELEGVIAPIVPEGMETTKTLYTNVYDPDTKSIANKLYLYDNNTDESNWTPLPDKTHRYTRVVIGGNYIRDVNGELVTKEYFYPIDFENDEGDGLEQIKRNWKYKFVIHSVHSIGYTDEETASEEPPVGLNYSIVKWNEKNGGTYFQSGSYNVWIDNQKVRLRHNAGSTKEIKVTSSVEADMISLEFEESDNGPTVKLPVDGDNAGLVGIQNDRFKVEKVSNADGDIVGLLFTALGDYDTEEVRHNSDVVIFTAGTIQFEITITQYDGAYDWIDGGDVVIEELGKKG